MKPFTQVFHDATFTKRAKVYKIHRELSCTADSLAKLAFSSPEIQFQDYAPGCSYETHEHQCPMIRALSDVHLPCCRVIAAS
jgi:hypothetical protein